MKRNRLLSIGLIASGLFTFGLSGCDIFKDYIDGSEKGPSVGKNTSVTPPLVKKLPGFEYLKITSVIGSDDTLELSPNFRFGGSADGAGLLKDGNYYQLIVNHEDNFSVSRITLDKKLKPVKGEYILNSDGGQWRLCSSTLATPKVHGFGPLYLTCGESGVESRTHAINPLASAYEASQSREKEAFGRWSAEQALPLPKDAYKNKTVILIGDDDSGAKGGQVAMYVGAQGDLDNGSLYMLKRDDGKQAERGVDGMEMGKKYAVSFVKIKNHKTLTGAEINQKVDELKGIKFGRVEDLDYRKGGKANSREIYFNVTGQDNSGANADYSRTKYGRVYKLTLDENDPTDGMLELVLDGDDKNGIAKTFQNVDNICVTENFVYTQEDPNGYGDETHDSYIYQYNIHTKELKKVLELDHRRGTADEAKYGVSSFGDWEYGAMIDVSEETGLMDAFMICIQPHTWRGEKYRNPDGGSKRINEDQASQVILVKGLPK
jgi:hypothetical protein